MNSIAIADNLLIISSRIEYSKTQSQLHKPVMLLAVTKQKSAEVMRTVWNLGVKNFGENYLQEAIEKINLLRDLSGINWHFIGKVQSNKTKLIAENFAWVHSVDNFKIAKRLNDQLPASKDLLNICIQVNISEEATKSGISIKGLEQLMTQIMALPRLKLRGLMAIPKAHFDIEKKRSDFKKLATLMENINEKYHLALDTLSMGMSADFEIAIEEGATIVRIGSALFGKRV